MKPEELIHYIHSKNFSCGHVSLDVTVNRSDQVIQYHLGAFCLASLWAAIHMDRFVLWKGKQELIHIRINTMINPKNFSCARVFLVVAVNRSSHPIPPHCFLCGGLGGWGWELGGGVGWVCVCVGGGAYTWTALSFEETSTCSRKTGTWHRSILFFQKETVPSRAVTYGLFQSHPVFI